MNNQINQLDQGEEVVKAEWQKPSLVSLQGEMTDGKILDRASEVSLSYAPS